jgi:hypothetical protein
MLSDAILCDVYMFAATFCSNSLKEQSVGSKAKVNPFKGSRDQGKLSHRERASQHNYHYLTLCVYQLVEKEIGRDIGGDFFYMFMFTVEPVPLCTSFAISHTVKEEHFNHM